MSVQQKNKLRMIVLLVVCPIIALFVVPQDPVPVLTLYWLTVASVTFIAPFALLHMKWQRIVHSGNKRIARLQEGHYLDNIPVQTSLGTLFGALSLVEGWLLTLLHKPNTFAYIVINNLILQGALLIALVTHISWLFKVQRKPEPKPLTVKDVLRAKEGE